MPRKGRLPTQLADLPHGIPVASGARLSPQQSGHLPRGTPATRARQLPSGRLFGVFGIPYVSHVAAGDVDDSALPPGTLIQHFEDDTDGWWVSAARHHATIELRIYDVATIWLDADLAQCTVRPAPDVGDAWLAFQLERHLLPLVRMIRGEAVFHAGAVATDRGAVLLLADGQGGKSTATALLLADGTAFISDDQTGVTAELAATGTPGLRLRTHSAELAPTGADTRGEGDRLLVDLQPPHEPTPIAGLLLLGPRSGSHEAALEPVEGTEAVTALLGQVFCGGLVDASLVERHFDVAAKLAATRPIARLAIPHGPPWVNVLPVINRWLAAST
jgi:hypothetical protein